MQEVNIISLLIKLTNEYQELYGKMNFLFKKINNEFIFTDMDQKLLELLNIKKHDIVGRKLTDILACEKTPLKLDDVCQKAWKGKQSFHYCTFDKNKNVLLMIILNPIKKNNKVYIVEGRCLSLDSKQFQHKGNISNICKMHLSLD